MPAGEEFDALFHPRPEPDPAWLMGPCVVCLKPAPACERQAYGGKCEECFNADAPRPHSGAPAALRFVGG